MTQDDPDVIDAAVDADNLAIERDHGAIQRMMVELHAAHFALVESLQLGDLVTWDLRLMPVFNSPTGACVYLGCFDRKVKTTAGTIVNRSCHCLLGIDGERYLYDDVPFGVRVLSRTAEAVP